MGQKGITLWFTGLPQSGKTTIAALVAKELKKKKYKVEHLDGDGVRKNLTSDLGFSRKDRDENIRRITYVAKLLTRNGIITLVSFVSPYKLARARAKKEIKNFVEIYVNCPIEECIARDTRGMYKKALKGEIKNFTGISDPYEKPKFPDIVLETNKISIRKAKDKILKYLKNKKLI